MNAKNNLINSYSNLSSSKGKLVGAKIIKGVATSTAGRVINKGTQSTLTEMIKKTMDFK